MATQAEGGTRKLAAIMFTDIKGFSWKMATDELAAMHILKTHDTMMKEVIDQFGGRVIKSIGDSFMVDFPSAVNAVSCAIQLQRNFWQFNDGKSEFEKIEVRMGIHLGDVIDVGTDMFGDGVNIASRVEAITEPNRICITQDIYSQIKKKMNLPVFNIGSMKFKNIDEPVGVFEILIDDIPELSVPSETAKQAPSRKAAEKISAEEAKEAQTVEATKLKLEKENEERIRMHYKRAEILFQKGKYDDAEAELAKIEALTTPPKPVKVEAKPSKEEEEKQKQIQAHYKSAEELFQAGKLDEAEKAINEIYKLVPIHYGAQMIMAQIEEERFRLAEERRRKIEAERRSLQERTEKLETMVDRARHHFKAEEFEEALIVVQEVYGVDADNAEAKSIEAEIHRIQQEREEQQRREAEEAARRLAETLEKRAEHARSFDQPEEVEKTLPRKLYMQIGIGVAALIVLYVLVTTIWGVLFPTRVSIAVLSISQPSPGSTSAQWSNGIAALLAEDFAKHEHVIVIAPTTALASALSTQPKDSLIGELGVGQLVIINAQKGSVDFTVDVELYELERQSIWKETFAASNALSLGSMRETIVERVLDLLGVSGSVPSPGAATGNNEAYEQYLEGTVLVETGRESSVRLGVEYLKLAVQTDDRFGEAYSRLAKGMLKLYKLGGESDRGLLNETLDYADAAVRLSPDDAFALQVAGEVHRYRQQFAAARTSLERCLQLQPASAGALRALAQLDLIEGNRDRALERATLALRLDPRNWESHFTLGLVSHLRGQFENALTGYSNAIRWGASDSLITLRYRTHVWLTPEMEKQRAIDFYSEQLERSPLDYRYYYWLARAYERVGRRFEGPGQDAYQRGIALAESLLTIYPNDGSVLSYLGLLRVRFRADERAKSLIDRAITLYPNVAEYRYRKANVHAILGEKEKESALDALREAVRMEYNFSELLNPDFDAINQEPEFLEILVVKPSQ
jgi:class 3 adenylate cyclase/predicted Zn-dependent protease/TolB-like protein